MHPLNRLVGSPPAEACLFSIPKHSAKKTPKYARFEIETNIISPGILIKSIKQSRPNSVLNVPPEEDEKEVKISRTPLVLKYLKNNWIWHNKNGMEV
jgi:hypothetical protein